MLCFVFAALVVLLDQFIKRWVVLTIPLYDNVDFIPGVIGLTHIENTGAAFSMLSDHRWLLAGISFAATLGLIFVLLRYNEGFWGTLGLASVLGGTVGNLIDRAFNGYVVDMFRPLFVEFAVFNIADIFITLGGITFCVFFIYTSFRPPAADTVTPESAGGQYFDDEDDDQDYDRDYDEDYDEWGSKAGDSLDETKTIPTGRRATDHISRAGEQNGETGRGDVYVAVTEQYSYADAEQEQSGYNYTDDTQRGGDDYGSSYEIAADGSETLDSLASLESELGKLDDYDVGALLREYGFEEDF